MDYKSATTNRFALLRSTKDGHLQAEWQLTDTRLIDAVKLCVPPAHAIPIIFVPGIMGSNLCNLRGDPVWLLNSVKNVPAGLALSWATQDAGARQRVLHPARTRVFSSGNVPSLTSAGLRPDEYRRRGWGEVSEASYHSFLLWLERKMNGDPNPANWDDFSSQESHAPSTAVQKLSSKLTPGVKMDMADLPKMAESGHQTQPITSDDLLRRASFTFPVYAFGYNWLDSNKEAALLLKARLEKVIAENNTGGLKCTQVILVTHSMGGLVARACIQLPGASNMVLGVVHGVMPATGAPVAYRRCKVGMRDEDFKASLVIGTNGQEVSAVFAQAPGALQLLPAETYGTRWLNVNGPAGYKILSLPEADPYQEIYLERKKWWGLLKEEWLSPDGGIPINWDTFVLNISKAKQFHRWIAGKYHHNTFSFYGGGVKHSSFANVTWVTREGRQPTTGKRPTLADLANFEHGAVRTDGSNAVHVGGGRELIASARGATPVETSYWSLHAAAPDSSGDGTVPKCSGAAPRSHGGRNLLQQFEVAGVEHEPAYRDSVPARQITLYAVTKLAALTVTS